MSNLEVIQIAAQFLTDKNIKFVNAGVTIGRDEGYKKEVIFPAPETLDPMVAIVDPPDVRVWVWVYVDESKAELIRQM